MTLTNYVVINKKKYEVCISLRNHLVKSWHHHEKNFFQFRDGESFFQRMSSFLGLKSQMKELSTSYPILSDIKFHVFDMHISIQFHVKPHGCLH